MREIALLFGFLAASFPGIGVNVFNGAGGSHASERTKGWFKNEERDSYRRQWKYVERDTARQLDDPQSDSHIPNLRKFS